MKKNGWLVLGLVFAAVIVAIAVSVMMNFAGDSRIRRNDVLFRADEKFVSYELVDRMIMAMNIQTEVNGIRYATTTSIMYAHDRNVARLDLWHHEAEWMQRIALGTLEVFEDSVLANSWQSEVWKNSYIYIIASIRTWLDMGMEVFYTVQAYARVGNHNGALAAIGEGVPILNRLVHDANELVRMTISEMYEWNR